MAVGSVSGAGISRAERSPILSRGGSRLVAPLDRGRFRRREPAAAPMAGNEDSCVTALVDMAVVSHRCRD